MGACSFTVIVFGQDIEDAFRNAQDQARSENGHRQGYSGDIQTKHNWVDVTEQVGMYQMYEKIGCLISQDPKFMDRDGPAGAVVLSGKRAKEWREKYGMTGKRGKVVCFFGMARS